MWSPPTDLGAHRSRGSIRGRRPAAAGSAPVLLVLLVTLLSGGCAAEPATEPEEMEPVEISAGPTSAMTPDSDEVAAPGDERLIGVLPGGFPETFPLPEPASVVDFGSEDDRFVVLRTTLSRDEASRQLARRLDASGWAAAGDRWTRTKGRDRVVVRFETGDAGQTLMRIEYGSR